MTRAVSLFAIGVLGLLAAACGTKTITRTVTRTVTVSRALLQRDVGTAESEPLRVTANGVRCGAELWQIKTLVDPKAAHVQLDPVLPTDIAAVNALPVPTDPTTRVDDNFELHSYRITAFLVGYKLEADNDWHIVLSDDGSESRGHTMIIEIPNPACAEPPAEATTSRVLMQITQARAAFETAFPPAKACFSCNLKTQVTVVGIGFFDKLHGQHGVAINGAELHPVLGFELGGGPTPTPATTTATTTTTTPAPPPTRTHGKGCNRYPGRHWYKHTYHRNCRPNFFFTKYGG